MRPAQAVSWVLAALALGGCRINPPPGGGGGQGQIGPQGAPGSGVCTTGTVCLRVVTVAPGLPLAGRLALVWMPIGDDDSSFLPELGYDAPFFGNERTVTIPYGAVTLPRRSMPLPPCFDARRPECNRLSTVATGTVLVLSDLNGNGRVDLPGELGKSGHTAVARVVVGYGSAPVEPGGALRDVFPAGIAGGLAPYAVSRPPGRTFDQLVLAQQGTLFDLVSCTTALPRCNLPYPNLN